MAFGKLWTIAWRDLGRNKRRSFFSILAVGLGLALLIVMDGFVTGYFGDTLENSIRLESGHLQLRAPSYEIENMSLLWEDLLENPEDLAAQASALAEVEAAAPVLWANGYLNTRDESVGLRIYGVDTDSEIYSPFSENMVSGHFLTADDRSGILIGKRLADSLGLGEGDTVSAAIINSDGRPDEAQFTIRGVYETGVFSYDDSALLMPLAKAQAFANTGGRASAVTMWLTDEEAAEVVAAALARPEVETLTWRTLNEMLLETFETGKSFYVYMYGIVILIVAVLIANTLLMAVFERMREIGILASLGMRRSQITLMFLLEAVILGVFGVILGNVMGAAGVAALAAYGIPAGDMGAAAANMAIGSSLNAEFNPPGMISLSAWTMIITMLAALYPAWYAARQEPVDALHAL
jgi:ABC-type lipoprotein release transport system permease subunit